MNTRVAAVVVMVGCLTGCACDCPKVVSVWIQPGESRGDFQIKYMNGADRPVRLYRSLLHPSYEAHAKILEVYWNGEQLDYVGSKTEASLSHGDVCSEFEVIPPKSELVVSVEIAKRFRVPDSAGTLTVVHPGALNFCESGDDGSPGQIQGHTWVGTL